MSWHTHGPTGNYRHLRLHICNSTCKWKVHACQTEPVQAVRSGSLFCCRTEKTFRHPDTRLKSTHFSLQTLLSDRCILVRGIFKANTKMNRSDEGTGCLRMRCLKNVHSAPWYVCLMDIQLQFLVMCLKAGQPCWRTLMNSAKRWMPSFVSHRYDLNSTTICACSNYCYSEPVQHRKVSQHHLVKFPLSAEVHKAKSKSLADECCVPVSYIGNTREHILHFFAN